MVKADFQSHFSTRSLVLPYDKVIDSFSRRLGPGSIGTITNCGDSRYEAWADQAQEYRGIDLGNAIYDERRRILVVKTEEVNTSDGQLLVVGHPRDFHVYDVSSSENPNLEEAIKRARQHPAIIAADHPFARNGIGARLKKDPALVDLLDAFEVHNGQASESANIEAKIFFTETAKKQNPFLGALSNSDGNTYMEAGTCYTFIPWDVDRKPLNSLESGEEIIENLKEGFTNQKEPHIVTNQNYIGRIKHAAMMITIIAARKLGYQRDWAHDAALIDGDPRKRN